MKPTQCPARTSEQGQCVPAPLLPPTRCDLPSKLRPRARRVSPQTHLPPTQLPLKGDSGVHCLARRPALPAQQASSHAGRPLQVPFPPGTGSLPPAWGGGPQSSTTPWPSRTDTALLRLPLKFSRSDGKTEENSSRRKSRVEAVTQTSLPFAGGHLKSLLRSPFVPRRRRRIVASICAARN